MTTVVLPSLTLSRASLTIFSFSASSDEVASSKISMLGFLTTALAIAVNQNSYLIHSKVDVLSLEMIKN